MTLIQIETDADLGVPSRVFDLLAVQDRLPENFNLRREGDGMTLRMSFPDLAIDRAVQMIARIRQIPGVRSADPVKTPAL